MPGHLWHVPAASTALPALATAMRSVSAGPSKWAAMRGAGKPVRGNVRRCRSFYALPHYVRCLLRTVSPYPTAVVSAASTT